MDSPFIEKAIPMVAVDEKSGKYVLTDQAIKFFKAITGPIAVVSVAGLYRTGKSYLLNRVLLNRSNGFGVGPTVNPCTKGLWCWGMPIKGTSTDGEPVTIVVIDTEGIGALDEDQTHDTKIFTLAILASSCFIYNSVGSIDETAIQNLSLVVNLTKHIQLKAQNSNEEGEDPDEISTYFPTFYWVVRDFSLQLQDPQGNPITPKEYLQRALAPQNGFSDDIQQKNRIRRLLTAFFKDRDCVTMVRPLVDETKLQNLDKMDYDELRLEFASQAMTFRKRIVTSVKPKTLQNQKLNGNLYCSMMSSYVKAINEGAVPNIENAWSYMCEQQCRRAQEECYEVFITSIKEHWKEQDNGFSEEMFNKFTTQAEEKAIQLYREKALGSHMGEGLKELRAQMKEKIVELCEKNKKWSQDKMKAYLKEVNKTITKKISQKEYASYPEYEKEVTAIHDKVIKEGPKLHDYRFVYADAFRKMFPQGANFLFKEFTKQHQREVEMFKEKEKQTAGELQYIKKQYDSLKKKHNQMITETDQKILELTNRSECLQEQLDITLQSKKQQENKMERYYGTKQMQNNSAKRALQEKLAQSLSRLDDVTKQYQLQQQNWLKDKTVFQQQIKHQLSQIEELQKKEKSLDAAMSVNKANMTKEVRQLTMRLETEKENLKMQLEGKIEKMNELTEEFNNLKAQFEEKTEYFEKKEKKFKEDLTNAKRESEKTRKDLEMEKKQLRQELQNQESVLREQFQLSETRLKESEKALKELTEKFRVTKGDLQKQRSLLEQQMGFMKQENDSLRSKVTQLKESHQMALASYQASLNQQNQENMSKHIIQMKTEHANEIQALNHTFDSEKNRMTCQFTNITNKLFETETRFAAYSTEKELKEKNLNSEIEDLKMQLVVLNAEKAKIQAESAEYMAARQSELDSEIMALKAQLDECKTSNMANLERLNKDSQLQLQRLRNQVAEERMGYKKKLKEEKDKIEKNNRQEMEEKEAVWDQQRTELETRNEELAQQIGYLNEQLTNQTQQLQKENQKLNRQIMQLTKSLKDSQDSLETLKEEQAMYMDKMRMQYEEEKGKLEKKIEQLAQQCKDREKEGITFRHQYETTLEKYNRLEKQFSDTERLMKENEEKLRSQYQRMTVKHKQEENAAREAITVLTKNHALTQQNLQFTTTRVQELESQLSTIIKNSEEKLESLRTEKEAELKIATSKLISEKTLLDTKYQQLKATYKESERMRGIEFNEVAKQMAVLQEKTNHLEGKLMESQSSRTEEVGNLKTEVSRLKQTLANKEKQIKDAYLTFNTRIDRLQSEKSELMSNLDKEKSLAEQREIMHTRAREENKRQNDERIKTLEMQLAREQNNRMVDKNAYDSNHTRMLSDIDLRNRQKVQDLTDALTKIKYEKEAQMLAKDTIIKQLTKDLETQKVILESRNDANERKLKQLETSFDKLKEETEKLRSFKAGKEGDRFKKENQEKEVLKSKIQTLQRQAKENVQNVRKTLLDFEMERTKWNMERESLQENMSNAEDVIKRLTKDKERLIQEKEKLKSNRMVNVKGTSYIAGMKTTYEPMKSQKSVIVADNNKENTSYQ